MNVTKISVSSGQTISHPYESYANLRFNVHLEAELQADEDSEACVKELQIRADALSFQHKQQLLDALETAKRAIDTGRRVVDIEEDWEEYEPLLAVSRSKKKTWSED